MRSILNVLLIMMSMALVLSCGELSDEEIGTSERSDTESSDAPTGGDTEIGNDDEEESEPADDAAPEPSGDKTFTVRFRKGKTGRSYSNNVNLGAAHTYVLGASKGQTMSVSITSQDSNALFVVRDPVGNKISDGEVGNTNFKKNLPANGNYRIVVSGVRGKSDYRISFNVSAKETVEAPPSSGPVTRTVRFRKGRSSATYKNAVIRGERDTYILGAEAHQLMTVRISSLENNAVFQIRGPGGGYLADAGPGDDARSWSGGLPQAGNYRVIVGPTRGNATYTITFSIR